MSWWDDWGPAHPVEGGLVASGTLRGTRIGADAQTVGAEIVRRLLERANSGVATRGRSYARSGQTVTMSIEPGRIHATVQGSSPQPYSVTIAFAVTDEQRRILISAFEHALPDPTRGIPARGTPSLRDEIDACGLLIGIPITANCTCPYGAVCKHCIALAYIAAERLDGSPIAIATLFGVRDEHLSAPDAGSEEPVLEPVTITPTFDSRRQAQLARALGRLDDRDPVTVDDVIGRAVRTLRPTRAVLTQLGVEDTTSDQAP